MYGGMGYREFETIAGRRTGDDGNVEERYAFRWSEGLCGVGHVRLLARLRLVGGELAENPNEKTHEEDIQLAQIDSESLPAKAKRGGRSSD